MEPNISNESSLSFACQRPVGALWLALAATATALSISALAGWQRGGSLSERLVWISLSVVLVVSAHMLPGFVRGASVAVRCVAWSLWIACMATACYGHATFFVLAQRHAGELRASATPATPVANSVRSLTAVMAERATVIGQLAGARARYCAGNCVTLEARRVTLAARLDALDTEADDIRRSHIADDRVTRQRDALLADPVASRLAALLGVTDERIDLFSGLAFATVLEGVACLLWTVALRAPPVRGPVEAVSSFAGAHVPIVTAVTDATQPVVTAVEGVTGVTRPAGPPISVSRGDRTVDPEVTVTSQANATRTRAPPGNPVTALPETGTIDDDLTRLLQDLNAGRVRPTVADIRRHFGCSQARATALRRQLANRNFPA